MEWRWPLNHQATALPANTPVNVREVGVFAHNPVTPKTQSSANGISAANSQRRGNAGKRSESSQPKAKPA